MGDRLAPSHQPPAVARHRLRIRTIAVSFAAAVASARRDLRTSPAERDALIEVWRTWSLDALERYGRDIPALADDAAARDGLQAELTAAVDSVRHA